MWDLPIFLLNLEKEVYMANLASCVAHVCFYVLHTCEQNMCYTRVSKHVLYTCEHTRVTHV